LASLSSSDSLGSAGAWAALLFAARWGAMNWTWRPFGGSEIEETFIILCLFSYSFISGDLKFLPAAHFICSCQLKINKIKKLSSKVLVN